MDEWTIGDIKIKAEGEEESIKKFYGQWEGFIKKTSLKKLTVAVLLLETIERLVSKS